MERSKDDKKIIVLYHAECPDGFGASYAAWKKFGDDAIYMPVFHQSLPPKEIECREVYTLDYSYSEEIINEFKGKIKSLKIVDHHISNQDAVKLADDHLFDVEHSGSVLTWKYFHSDKPVPKFFKYIEDVDLWNFKLPYSKEISQVINFQDFDYKIWDKVISDFEDEENFKKFVEDGKLLVKNLDRMVAKIILNAEKVKFEGIECYMVNSPVYVSHVGHALVQKHPPIAVIWSRSGGRITVSLRSDGIVDVSKLAQKYGGGGHKAAAGFSFEYDMGNLFDFLKES